MKSAIEMPFDRSDRTKGSIRVGHFVLQEVPLDPEPQKASKAATGQKRMNFQCAKDAWNCSFDCLFDLLICKLNLLDFACCIKLLIFLQNIFFPKAIMMTSEASMKPT